MGGIDLLVGGLVVWFLVSFLVKFVNSYQEISDEREAEQASEYVCMQIDVERVKELWYGWFIDPETKKEVFVAQGESCRDAISNCVERIRQQNPNFTILFKFRVKYDEQPSIQNQTERNDSQ
jgi:hypothetical protein